MDKVLEFLQSHNRAEWIMYDGMQVYVRKSRRKNPLCIETFIMYCFDVANVEVVDKGQGTFTRWLDDVKALVSKYPQYHAIYIESVLNQRLAEHFKKQGLIETAGIDRNFFLML